MLMGSALYFVLLVVATLILGGLAAFSWVRRAGSIALPFGALMVAGFIWALGSAGEIASELLAAKLAWRSFAYLGIVSVPLAWVTFALQYTGSGRALHWRALALLCAIPATTLFLAFTYESHDLLWKSTDLVSTEELSALVSEYGPWFWLHTAYSYFLLFVGTVIFIVRLVKDPATYSGQITGLLVGVLAPWVANIIYLSIGAGSANFDITPITFSISGLAFGYSIFRFQLFDIVPVAHHTVIRSLPDPVLVVDSDDRIISANPAAAVIIGCPERQLLGAKAGLVWDRYEEFVRISTESGSDSAEIELMLDRALRSFELRLIPLLDDNGRLTGRLVHLNDITDQKLAEAARFQSEQNFYGVLETLQDPYFESDNTGKMVYVNRAFANAVGLTVDEIIGRSFRRVVPREFVREFFEFFGQMYATGKAPTQRLKTGFISANREQNYVELMVTPVRNVDGTIIAARGIARDVTEQRLTEESLQQAKEAAEEANRSKSLFLANVSHELRTPLTSVLGFTRIIQKRLDRIFPHVDDSEKRTRRAMWEVQDSLEIIIKEAERLTGLINDVLDLAKIEAGKVEWNMADVSFVAVVERAVTATAGLFAGKPALTLVQDIPEQLSPVYGDQDRLIQVVINLISNAVKYTEEGVVECSAQEQDGQILFRVCDSGIGIEPEYHQKVFELFTQVVGDSLNDKPTGTGLGLGICKQIVEHHGGRIWVESEHGEGSTFSLTLPVILEQTSNGAEPIQLDALIRQLQKPLTADLKEDTEAQRVLIVDDEQSVRQMLKHEFEAVGYSVIEAANGTSAIQMVKAKRPDLVVLDILLPDLSGFDVAAVIKNDPLALQTPIIVISAGENRARGEHLGIEAYFAKPIDMPQLLADAQRILAEHGRKRTLVITEDQAISSILVELLSKHGHVVVTAGQNDYVEVAREMLPHTIIVDNELARRIGFVGWLNTEQPLKDTTFMLFAPDKLTHGV